MGVRMYARHAHACDTCGLHVPVPEFPTISCGSLAMPPGPIPVDLVRGCFPRDSRARLGCASMASTSLLPVKFVLSPERIIIAYLCVLHREENDETIVWLC